MTKKQWKAYSKSLEEELEEYAVKRILLKEEVSRWKAEYVGLKKYMKDCYEFIR